MEYNCKFKDEINNIIELIESEINQIVFSKNTLESKTLGKFFIEAIFQLITGSYKLIPLKLYLPTAIINRSLLEYVIDFVLISTRNNIKTNKLFYNHFKILAIDSTSLIDNFREIIPDIEKKFNQYIIEFYSTYELELKVKDKLKEKQISYDYADIKKSTKKYLRNWSGLNFQERFKSIVVESIINDDSNKSYSIFDKVEHKLKTNDPDDWESKRSDERIDSIIEELKGFENVKSIPNEKILEPLINIARLSNKFYSNYTHPTVFSIVPHFIMMTEKFEMEHEYHPDVLKLAEESLFFAIDTSIQAFLLVLKNNEKEKISKVYEKWRSDSSNIKSWLTS